MVEREARHADAELRLVGVLLVHAHVRAGLGVELGRRVEARAAVRGQVAEQLLERRDEVVADHAADADDHAVGRVPSST